MHTRMHGSLTALGYAAHLAIPLHVESAVSHGNLDVRRHACMRRARLAISIPDTTDVDTMLVLAMAGSQAT